VYHLQYHDTTDYPEEWCWNPWPSRQQLLAHFKEQSERFGILPYCRLSSNVKTMNIVGQYPQNYMYELAVGSTIADNWEESVHQVSSVSFFPGNLTNPKRVIYKGEEMFGGPVVYGISSAFDYADCKDRIVSIVGSGAFSVENVRTCVEYRAKAIYQICRRKTIAMPRIVSWLINQCENMISAVSTLNACEPMYDLIDVDAWGYYAVYANAARTQVTIRQKSRFGIGDVYFLAMYYGMNKHYVDDIKRVTYQKIHLVSGTVLEDVSCMLKLLGFNGEFENDRLLKIKELYGWWPNKDGRRYIVAEPIGVDASNFGGTSFSPGAIFWAEQQVWLLMYPQEYQAVLASGQMPVHSADYEIDRPAYVVEARHGSLAGPILAGCLSPAWSERGNIVGGLKTSRMRAMHPPDRFQECCKREWDDWSKTIQEMGYEKPHPPYPYTLDMVLELQRKATEENMKKFGF